MEYVRRRANVNAESAYNIPMEGSELPVVLREESITEGAEELKQLSTVELSEEEIA